MKEHSFPVILEQVCMVLVFAVAAAICLRVFAAADRISQENECMSEAVLFVQNTAEQLKGCNGDPASVLNSGWKKNTEEGWAYIPDEVWNRDCRIEILTEDSTTVGMGSARIVVSGITSGKEEKVLINIPVAWQEAADEQED